MRRYFIYFIVFLSMMDFALGQSLKVMTYNIRYDNPNDSTHSWQYRKDILVDVVKYKDADIVGMQEVLYNQLLDLDSLLTQYSYLGEGRDGGHNGEYSPIFFKKDRFIIKESNTFWLSEHPEEKGVKGWDAACTRIVTWAKVYDKETHDDFYFFNTHLDHQGTIARIKSAELILKKMKAIAGDKPLVLTGDFNSLPNSATYQLFTYWDNPLKIKDSRTLCETTAFGPNCTFISLEPDLSSEILIDDIFVKEGTRVLWHSIVTLNKNGFFPSDHLPVFTEIKL